MQSDCLGLGLKIIPNLSKSYRAAPACIISTAQHASPKVIGQMLPFRAQFTRLSTLVTTYSPALASCVDLDVCKDFPFVCCVVDHEETEDANVGNTDVDEDCTTRPSPWPR